VWARSNVDLGAVGTVTNASLLDNFYTTMGVDSIPGLTVARIRGVLIVRPDATPVDHTVVFGVRVAGSDSVTTGPLVNPYEDWMLWEPFMLAGAVTGLTQTDANYTRVIDVKAQRKLEEIGEVLRMNVSQSLTETATEVGWSLSIGLLLP